MAAAGLNHFSLKEVQVLLIRFHWLKTGYLLCMMNNSNVWRHHLRIADIYSG